MIFFLSGSSPSRRKMLNLVVGIGIGIDTINLFLPDLLLTEWYSKTWKAGTHYWRYNHDETLFFQYKDYGQKDLVSVQKFSTDGKYKRDVIPQTDVDSKKKALEIISTYR